MDDSVVKALSRLLMPIFDCLLLSRSNVYSVIHSTGMLHIIGNISECQSRLKLAGVTLVSCPYSLRRL